MANEEEVLRLEYQWLLDEEVPSVFQQLEDIVKICIQKFKIEIGSPSKSVYKTDNFLLSLPSSDSVKGLISIAGVSVVKGDLKFKIPKVANGIIGTFIFEQCPWKLQQLQDAHNHLQCAIEIIQENEITVSSSSVEVNQVISDIMAFLNRGKNCLLVPLRQPLTELMAVNAQRVLNPPIPEELLVNFHVNCDKIVFSVHVLNCLSSTPSNQKQLNTDFNLVGHVFECNGRWYEVINRIEIVCTVPWLKELLILFSTAQQLCQQLRDKISMFQNLLPVTDLSKTKRSSVKV